MVVVGALIGSANFGLCHSGPDILTAVGLRWDGDIVAGRVLKPFIASSSKSDRVQRLDEVLVPWRGLVGLGEEVSLVPLAGRVLYSFVASRSMSAKVRRLDGRIGEVAPFFDLEGDECFAGDFGEKDFDTGGRGDKAIASPT